MDFVHATVKLTPLGGVALDGEVAIRTSFCLLGVCCDQLPQGGDLTNLLEKDERGSRTVAVDSDTWQSGKKQGQDVVDQRALPDRVCIPPIGPS